MNLKFLFAFFLISYNFSFAQNINFSGEITGKGIAFSGKESPFWLHSNQRGRIDELTNIAGWATGLASYNLSDNSQLNLGLGVLYSDGYTDKVQLDESYIEYKNSWLNAYVGRQQREELYQGLSATNMNILWSLNARPLPGVSLEITRPIYFWKDAGLGFKASLEEFMTDDDRYVDDTRIHHKSFHLVFNKIENFTFTAGVQHFVQWGGTSPDFGKLPDGFDDYLKVFTGAGSGSEIGGGNEVNGLGNHLGSYELIINTSIGNYNIDIIYNHLFEDGSGMRLRNTPDGRYGIFLEKENQDTWIDALMYEFYYTRDQSEGSGTTDGEDNYFNNNLYRSGWTYENRILGIPFITLGENRFRINNNNIVAHHIGLTGTAFDKIPYKLLTSYRMNYGAKAGGNLRSDILSTYLDMLVYQNFLNINVQLGTDFSTINSPNFGAAVQVSKSFF